MEFIISQSQLELILTEQKNTDIFSESMKRLNSFTNNMVNRVFKTYDINLKMFLTWGTSIGGMVVPLNDFVQKEGLKLTESEKYLILCGVAFLIFFEGRRGFTKILNKIKEKGLEEAFQAVYNKAITLKTSFAKFLRSVNAVTSQAFDIVSYAFLIPIIVDVQDFARGSANIKETAMIITERLLASGLTLISRELLSSLLKRIIRRLNS